MASEQVVAAGLGAMNLFGTLLLGWIVVVAFAIHVTHSSDSSHGNLSTPPLAVIGALGFAALVAVFYAAEQTFLSGFDQVPGKLQHFETVVFGFLALSGLVFLLLVSKPLADSVSPIFRKYIDDPRRAQLAAYGTSFAFEAALTLGAVLSLVSSLPTITA